MTRKTLVYILALWLLSWFALSACQTPQRRPLPSPRQPNAAESGQNTGQQAKQSVRVDRVYRQVQMFNGKSGIYAKNLKTGQTIANHEHDIFPTASTHKLVVALAVYKYLYDEADKAEKREYDEQIKKMMTVSDNPAFYQLLDELEKNKPRALTQVLLDLGLTRTRIHSREAWRQFGYHSVTTPYEMAKVFETIYQGEYLGKKKSGILKEELAQTIFKEEIPRFISRSKIMHKVGSLPGVLCDVGIVDDGKDQILISVYTKTNRSEEYASSFIAEVSSKLYQELRSH